MLKKLKMKRLSIKHHEGYDYYLEVDNNYIDSFSILNSFYNKCEVNINNTCFYLSLKDKYEKQIYKAIKEGKVKKYE